MRIGIVPVESHVSDMNPLTRANGDLSPEWGIDFQFKDTIMNYGPWTDKKRFVVEGFGIYCRIEWSQFFFPYAHRTFPAFSYPKAGDIRVFPSFKMHFHFVGEFTLRMPTREQSKVLQHYIEYNFRTGNSTLKELKIQLDLQIMAAGAMSERMDGWTGNLKVVLYLR